MEEEEAEELVNEAIPEEGVPPEDQEEATPPADTEEATVLEEVPESKPEEEPEPLPPANEKIFLLEFIVDQLNLDYCLTRYLNTLEGPTCISFSFLNNGPFKVCEEDFTHRRNYTESVCNNSIKNGKSCLFSLTEEQVNEVRTSFAIDVEVNKNTTSGPDKLFVGQAHIECTTLFNDLMELVENGEGPVFNKMFKDCFRLLDVANREVVGHLSAYIRLSCFGKIIINQFQMNPIEETVDIKSYKGHYLFKFQNKSAQPDFSRCYPALSVNECPDVGEPSKPLPCPPPPCNTTTALPPNCHPTCLEQAERRRKEASEMKKPPCVLGLVKCNPPSCCHPKSNAPKPVCCPPPSKTQSRRAPLLPCVMRAMPCCVLRCDLGPKTCPCQQKAAENQSDLSNKSGTSGGKGGGKKGKMKGKK